MGLGEGHQFKTFIYTSIDISEVGVTSGHLSEVTYALRKTSTQTNLLLSPLTRM